MQILDTSFYSFNYNAFTIGKGSYYIKHECIFKFNVVLICHQPIEHAHCTKNKWMAW